MITRESGICPDKYQLKQIERRFGMFIHFGINTFANCEWSDGQLDKMLYNPSSLDCDGWVKTAAENGMKYVIITAKHHDGFCIWNTDTTEYCVKNTAFMTDVIAEVSKHVKSTEFHWEYIIHYGIEIQFCIKRILEKDIYRI